MVVLDFAGEYRCSLDIKNRLHVPASLRKQMSAEAEDTLVITSGFEGINLYAYPLNEWQRLTKLLRTLNPFEKNTRDFIRQFVGVAFYAVLDNQGRTMLPERILKMGKIEKDLLIFGSLTKLEIWNPDIYDTYKAENFNLTDLAEKIRFADMIYEKDE